jgi:prepilin-type processing-associated H-X9-DG protein
MKKFAILLGVLLCIPLAHAQPPDGPGMAQVQPPDAAPPKRIDERSEQEKQKARRVATREEFNKFNHPSGKLDLSSPEAAVRSCIWAIHNIDFKTALECVENPQPYEKFADYEAEARAEIEKRNTLGENLLITDLHTYQAGETAVVTLRVILLTHLADRDFPLASSERFVLNRHKSGKGSVWKIGNSRPSSALDEEKTHAIDLFAEGIALLSTPGLAEAKAQFEECQSNLKQLGLALFQKGMEFEETFIAGGDWKELTRDYAQDDSLFQCASEGRIYSINEALDNKKMDAVKQQSKIIYLYEGKDKKFEFRHEVNGVKFTNILFADGHVKAYSQETLDAAMKDRMVQWTLED